jgi:hypothetical protein
LAEWQVQDAYYVSGYVDAGYVDDFPAATMWTEQIDSGSWSIITTDNTTWEPING